MAAAVTARSVLRSSTACAGSTARISAGPKPMAALSPFRVSSQKPFSTRIFRSPVEMSSGSVVSKFSSLPGKVDQRNVACFSSLSKRTRRFRFQQGIDLKRDTKSTGVLERIEYDRNRTSRIALVRWKGGVHQRKSNTIEESFPPPEKRLESTTTTTIHGPFAFSSLPGIVDQSNNTGVRDIFFSAFSPKAKGEIAFDSSSGFPRIAVAGAKPAFFIFRNREKEVKGEDTSCLCEIRKWKPDSVLWQHRMKRKAALSWHSFRRQEILGLARASEHNKSKSKKDQGFYNKAKNGKCKVDRVPVSYIMASHQLEPGMMVMNY